MKGAIEMLGGTAKYFAAIVATFPIGSICTCTKDGKTLKAEDTSGVYIFPVPEPGNWTVAASLGDETASNVVSITEDAQVEKVSLTFALVLFDNGEQNKAVTGGWSKSGYSDGKYGRTNSLVSIGDSIVCSVDGYNDLGGIAGTANKVSLNGVSTLTITGNLADYDSSYSEFLIGLSSSKAIETPVASVKITAKGDFTKTLNVSSFNDSYYIFCAALRNDDFCYDEYTADLSVTAIKQTA